MQTQQMDLKQCRDVVLEILDNSPGLRKKMELMFMIMERTPDLSFHAALSSAAMLQAQKGGNADWIIGLATGVNLALVSADPDFKREWKDPSNDPKNDPKPNCQGGI